MRKERRKVESAQRDLKHTHTHDHCRQYNIAASSYDSQQYCYKL